MALPLAVFGILAMVCGSLLALKHESVSAAVAAGPCNPGSAAITGEESQFLGLVQQWRDAHIQSSVPLQMSGSLNAAAAMFAEYQVANGLQGGHIDNLGRNWSQRAADCGYDPFYSNGSGEGIYARASSAPLNLGPTDAIANITYGGSGIYIDTPPGFPPPKCIGVAVARNQNSTAVAWVLVIAQLPADQQCPQPVTGGGGGSTTTPAATSTATNTPTSTPTATPTRTPTPSPTPNANYNRQITIAAGWNLVTLPVGQLSDILDTARQCFAAVYEADGDHWLRYVPSAPGYASNLVTSTGGAFWILGTDANCGTVRI